MTIRLGWRVAVLKKSLTGVVLVLFGKGGLTGAPWREKEFLLLDVPVDNESQFVSGDVSGVVCDLFPPNSRRDLFHPLVLGVLCDDSESTLRGSDDRAE